MKKLILSLLLISGVCNAQIVEIGSPPVSGEALVEQIFNENNEYHDYSDAYYLQKRTWPVEGTFSIIFSNPDSTTFKNAVSVFDSIYTGTGRFATILSDLNILPYSKESRIEAGFCINPDSTAITRLGTQWTIAEARYIDSQTGRYELMTTTSSDLRLGWLGVYGGERPSHGSVTGTSNDLVSEVFESFQEFSQTWGLRDGFRSHVWCLDEYMLGVDTYLRDKGIYQAFGRARNINATQADHDLTRTYAQDGVPYSYYPSSRFAYGGNDRYVALHEIGERTDEYNYGGRMWNPASGGLDVTGGTMTNQYIKDFVDMAAHTSSNGVLIFPGRVGTVGADSLTNKDIKNALFLDFVIHILNRQAEGRITTITPEENVARKRGIREGELINHDGFTVLCTDNTYNNGGLASGLNSFDKGENKVPMGWSNEDQHYTSSADNFNAPGTAVQTSTNSRPTVMNLVADGDSINAVFNFRDGDLDSLTYALASPTGNVIMAGWQDATRGKPLNIQINTMGCETNAIRISGQFMIVSQVTTPDNNDSMYVSCKFGQVTELLENLMEGPSAGQINADILGYRSRIDTTALTADSLLFKERFWPQYLHTLGMADTTLTGNHAKMFQPMSDQLGWWNIVWMKSSPRLVPTIVSSSYSEDYQWRSTIGNPRDLTTTAVPSHSDAYIDDTEKIKRIARVYSFSFNVEIDEMTDAVSGFVCPEQLSGAWSSAPVMAWLNISAKTL